MSASAQAVPTPALPTEQESKIAGQSGRLLAACIGRGNKARVRVYAGNEEIEVPVSALRMLVDILAQMAEGNAVTIRPIHAELTTQEAADFLNVSRPYLVNQLLEKGVLPFHKVGSHRRVPFKELFEYRQRSRAERKQAVDELTEQSRELGFDK